MFKKPSWKPTPGVPAWMDLHQEILSSYCLDKLPLEHDADIRTYLRFRYLLGTAADLIFLYRKKLEQCYGRGAWQKASVLFEDRKRQTLFRFVREVSSTERPLAVKYLEAISRQGLRFLLPGGVPSCFWSKDCGWEAIVAITEEMLDFLNSQEASGDSSTSCSSTEIPSIKRHAQVWLDMTKTGEHVRLTTKGHEPIKLTRKQSQLLMTLYWGGLTEPDEALCKRVWPGKSLSNWDHGALGSLKNLVSSVNIKLADQWGMPPDQKQWINRDDAYSLNRSLRWAELAEKKNFKKNRSRSVDPSILADTIVDHRDGNEHG